jgi:hypothetical protein
MRGSYEGEALIHVMIIDRDEVALKMLLSKPDIDLQCRAHGTFFEPGKPTYYGEYPISFAVSTDWLKGLEMLKAYANSECQRDKSKKSFSRLLTLEDSYGNSALHMAVLHKRTEMFTWLRSNGADNTNKNCLGLTALSLAAALDDAVVFDHVLSDMYIIKWSFGPVTEFRLPLAQLETIAHEYHHTNSDSRASFSVDNKGQRFQGSPATGSPRQESPREADSRSVSTAWLNERAGDYRSVIEIVLMQRRGCVVVNPVINEILNLKWDKHGRLMFYFSCVVQIAYIVLLYLMCEQLKMIQIQFESPFVYDEDVGSSDDLNNSMRLLTSYELMTLLFTTVSWVGLILDLTAGWLAIQERLILSREEMAKVHRPTARIDDFEWKKMQDMAKYMTGEKMSTVILPISIYDVLCWLGQLFITIHCLIFLTGSNEVRTTSWISTVVLSLGVVLQWQSMMHLFVAGKHFGTLVIIIKRVLAKDIPSFLVFLIISCAGFSQGVNLLHVEEADRDFKTVLQGMLTMFRVLLGEKPSWTKSAIMNSEDLVGPVGSLYYVVFSVTTTIVLLRLMISMFNETYGGVKKVANEEWRLTLGQMILRTERRLKLILPRRYHHHMGVDDVDEVGCSYVFQRLNMDKFDGESCDGIVASFKDDTPPQDQVLQSLLRAVERQGEQIEELRRELQEARHQVVPKPVAAVVHAEAPSQPPPPLPGSAVSGL